MKELSLADDGVKFVASDDEYERKKRLMSNCRSCLKRFFKSHPFLRKGFY
ncbi:MAG: hypothetical protein IJS52_08125 [Bacilli bacterium]|nr:hypothetical protein [Bacilli bacterium]